MAKKVEKVKNDLGKKVRSITTLNNCEGYDSLFIDNIKGIKSDLLSKENKSLLPKVNDSKRDALHYTNLSVYTNTKRKMPFYVAYNIDGEGKKKVIRDLDFIPEPRVSADDQLNDGFYKLRKGKGKGFDKGHMAANNELAWNPDAQTKSYQTFFYTNTCPQAAILNRGLWKTLETYFINESNETVNTKINVFTGPILKDNDPTYVDDKSFKLPLHFYKVVVFKFNKKFFSTGFIMSQKQALIDLKLIEAPLKLEMATIAKITPPPFEDFSYKDIFQVNVEDISQETGIPFAWSGVTPLKVEGGKKRLKTIDEIENSKQAKAKLSTIKSKSNLISEKFFIEDTKIGFVFPA